MAKLEEIVLFVSDPEKSLEFYREILNFNVVNKSESVIEISSGQKENYSIMLTSNSGIESNTNNNTDNNSIQNTMLVFKISDLNELKNTIQEKGIKIRKDVADESYGKSIIIEDYDGHLISLVEVKVKDEMSQIPYYHGFAPT
ncbi:MAG: VOC family protein [Nitrososphaeraceae archaeon]